MASPALENVPDEVMARLKIRAKPRQERQPGGDRHPRCSGAASGPVDTEALLARLRATRVTLRGRPLTQAELNATSARGAGWAAILLADGR